VNALQQGEGRRSTPVESIRIFEKIVS
jgi:hypothetical protein